MSPARQWEWTRTRTGSSPGLVSADVAFDQRDVAFAAVDFALVGDDAEVAVGRGQYAFGDAEDVALVLQAVADEFGYGEHLEAVLGAELR